MIGQPAPKFREDRPFEKPEAAARELIRIAKTHVTAKAPFASTGVTNSDFLYVSRGSVPEYTAGRDFAIAAGWFRIDESGTRIYLLPAGDALT